MEKVKTIDVAQALGKSTVYVSNWIRLHPSLDIKYTLEKVGRRRYRFFEKSEADRLVKCIKSGKYPQERSLSPYQKAAGDEIDFSDPAWWEY